MVGVSYDSVQTLKDYAEKQEITYPLLSDEQSKVIDAYGVRNKNVRSGSRQDGIPHPGTFLLDKTGVIRAKLFKSVRIRHTTDALLEAAEKIGSG